MNLGPSLTHGTMQIMFSPFLSLDTTNLICSWFGYWRKFLQDQATPQFQLTRNASSYWTSHLPASLSLSRTCASWVSTPEKVRESRHEDSLLRKDTKLPKKAAKILNLSFAILSGPVLSTMKCLLFPLRNLWFFHLETEPLRHLLFLYLYYNLRVHLYINAFNKYWLRARLYIVHKIRI